MVNTLGLSRGDLLSALGAAAGCRWEPVRPYRFAWNPIPNCFCAIINGALVILDLRADDGFDEEDYDHALGHGTAQRSVDKLRAEKGALESGLPASDSTENALKGDEHGEKD